MVLVLAVSYFASMYLGQNIKLKMLVERIFLVSKRFFGVPSFFKYAIADGIYNLLFPDKTALRGIKPKNLDDFQLSLFRLKTQETPGLFCLTADRGLSAVDCLTVD